MLLLLLSGAALCVYDLYADLLYALLATGWRRFSEATNNDANVTTLTARLTANAERLPAESYGGQPALRGSGGSGGGATSVPLQWGGCAPRVARARASAWHTSISI